MNYRIDVRITAPVQDTEVPERVVEAVTELFPEAEARVEDGRVVARARALDRFAERLREQRILDTARSHLREQRHGEGFAVDLKKQAAREGVVNFAVGSPAELGDIHVDVTVEEPDVETFIGHLAPPTDGEGRPVEGDADGADGGRS
jgi:predicted RNA binding protein with dsRBD fold (UPF0201 family)